MFLNIKTITCKSIGCNNTAQEGHDICEQCSQKSLFESSDDNNQSLSEKYPQYYKPVGDLTEVDVYAVHHLFNLTDPSGCLHHSSKKILLSGVRTGGKSAYKDIKEARDTLTRWLQLNAPNQ